MRGVLLLYLFYLNEQGLQGRTFAPYASHHPVEKRSCTDCICLIIFLALSVGLLAVGVYAWTNGNFKRLTTAYDADAKGCGVDYPDYPYIYFASPHADVPPYPLSPCGSPSA